MTKSDAFGAPVSSRNQSSIDIFNEAVTLKFGFKESPLEKIDEALAADPDFVMGHCFRACLFLVSSETAAEPELKNRLKTLRGLANKANDRERQYIAAIDAWANRRFHESIDRLGRIALEYPRDIAAVQITHQADFLVGQATMQRDRVLQILPAWSETDPEFGFLLGLLAYGYEETGQYALAEETGKRAVALNPHDAFAYHAVAHVYEMQGRTEDGISWLADSSENWSPHNMLAFHNWWHLALFHLENNDTTTVLRLYDDAIRPKPTDLAMEMVDGASMLWRLHLRKAAVGDRWDELVDIYEGHAADAYYPYNDAHAMMAFVATGRGDASQRLLTALEDAAGDRDSGARIIRDVGLPVVRAIRAFGDEDYKTCIDLLLDVRKRAAAFGGSVAQRDFLNLTLIEAAIRAGDKAVATGIVNERSAAKKESPFAECLMKRIRGVRTLEEDANRPSTFFFG